MWTRERRLVVLAAILLSALGYLLFWSDAYFNFRGAENLQDTNKVLPGSNEIISVTQAEVSAYSSALEIEYFYNGSAGPYTTLRIEIPVAAVAVGPATRILSSRATVSPGRNKVTINANRLYQGVPLAKSQTQTVKATIIGPNGEALVSRDFDQVIDWPSSDPFSLASNKPAEIERLYTLCVETIDAGQRLDDAKRGLEQILLAKPDYVSAYVEMARYQLQTNWGSDGFLQAEQLLKTALRLDANHINTLVLTGFVYAQQHRFKEAEAVLRKAEAIDKKYIWVYVNWGNLRALEGRRREAIENFQKAIIAAPTIRANEMGRTYAYERLLVLLTAEQRWTDVENLHQQRITKYPENVCFKVDYAGFRLARNGDYDDAIAIGDKVIDQHCRSDRFDGRLILAMAYYTKWAKLSGSGASARETDQYFSRGQALYSDMPVVLYSLARSPHTAIVIPALKQRGVGIDAPDREGVSALGHSVIKHDIEAGQVLIRQGANVNQRMYSDGLTPLMIAASRGSHAIVTMLLKNGADRKLRTRTGYTAERIAAESGFKEIATQLAAPSGV